jgi:hypothetical protein
MFKERAPLYEELEKKRNSRLLVYVTGDRQGMQTQMATDAIDKLVEHLDLFGSIKKVSLFLHTIGGLTNAGWSIANLIRSFCDEFEVIVATRAHSAGTLLCLGADNIIMTKQATLSPIDPSVNTPLNPQIPAAGPQAKVPVSVESIKGFIELAKKELGIVESSDLTQVLTILANNVHPLVLGDVFRARSSIRMLARNLLEKQLEKDPKKEQKIEKTVSFLCSDSWSHDYTINRREAHSNLGLKIEKPDAQFYTLIMKIYKDIENELELRNPFIPNFVVANKEQENYICRRALVESLGGKTDIFVSKGTIIKKQITLPTGTNIQLQDIRTFEGWEKENE